MIKIAFVSGRPQDGTALPKTEKFVWKEICRVMKNDLAHFGDTCEFLIPIYTKFDLEALRIAENRNIKVTYYLPNEEWGTKALPTYQLDLIRRMREDTVIIPGGYMKRIHAMIEDADVVYTMPGTNGFEQFEPTLKNKLACSFSFEDMLYQTEEEAKAKQESRLKETPIYVTPQQIKDRQDEEMERFADQYLSDMNEDEERFGQSSLYLEDDLPDSFRETERDDSPVDELNSWLRYLDADEL